MTTAVAVAFAVVFGFLVLSQLMVRQRARAFAGKLLPILPGALGKQLAAADRALLYFMSPQCGACRPWTARFKDMSARNPAIHVVNVVEDLALARALGVMATPTTLVKNGENRVPPRWRGTKRCSLPIRLTLLVANRSSAAAQQHPPTTLARYQTM